MGSLPLHLCKNVKSPMRYAVRALATKAEKGSAKKNSQWVIFFPYSGCQTRKHRYKTRHTDAHFW